MRSIDSVKELRCVSSFYICAAQPATHLGLQMYNMAAERMDTHQTLQTRYTAPNPISVAIPAIRMIFK